MDPTDRAIRGFYCIYYIFHTYCFWVSVGRIFMPPPLGAGGIMFSGCPSIRPSVRSLKYPLLTCTWVRWSTRPTVTVLPHVRPSVRLSGEVSGHLPENTWREWPGILHADVSWPSSELIILWPWSVEFSNFGTILCYFYLVKLVKFGFQGIVVMLCGFPSLWWPFGWNLSYLGFLGIIWRTCGSKCRGEGGGIFPTLCVQCCLVSHGNGISDFNNIWYHSQSDQLEINDYSCFTAIRLSEIWWSLSGWSKLH